MKKFTITLMVSALLFAVTSINKINAQTTGTFTDSRDGKTYKTVKIDSQTWLAENLAYNTGSGNWAYADNRSNIEKYGYLYNFETAKNVCPNGWKLPSKNDWDIMLKHFGTRKDAGYSLHPGGGSGFNITYGGYKNKSNPGIYSNKEAAGQYWTSNNENYDTWAIEFGNNPFFFWRHIRYAISVRCIQD